MSNDVPKVSRFEAITPRVPVADIEAALAFYIEKLGFELGWKWGDPVTHAGVCRDSINLDLLAVPAARQGTAMAYILISGVDHYFSEVKARGAAVGEPGDRPYGMRDFEVTDPGGNRLLFGEPLQ